MTDLHLQRCCERSIRMGRSSNMGSSGRELCHRRLQDVSRCEAELGKFIGPWPDKRGGQSQIEAWKLARADLPAPWWKHAH